MPDHLVVLGGSYVALEFAQMFRHFGSKVSALEPTPQLPKKEDVDVIEILGGVLREEGTEIHLNCSVERVEKEGKGIAVVLPSNGKLIRVSGSHLLVALGRMPNAEKLNLAAAGVENDKRGFIKVNERL